MKQSTSLHKPLKLEVLLHDHWEEGEFHQLILQPLPYCLETGNQGPIGQ